MCFDRYSERGHPVFFGSVRWIQEKNVCSSLQVLSEEVIGLCRLMIEVLWSVVLGFGWRLFYGVQLRGLGFRDVMGACRAAFGLRIFMEIRLCFVYGFYL